MLQHFYLLLVRHGVQSFGWWGINSDATAASGVDVDVDAECGVGIRVGVDADVKADHWH